MIITHAGLELLGKALTGKELHFTRAFVGDGQLDGKTPYEIVTLISPRKELPIQSIRTSATGTCEVVLEVSNRGQETGYWLREYGLYARDPDTQNEVLYSYCNKGDEAGYIEGFDGINPIDFSLTLVTVIDQAQNVTATITTNNSYVTVTRLESRVQDIYASSSDIAGVWTYGQNTEGRISPQTWQDFKLALFGVTDIESLNHRLERLEDNVAQTLLMLEMRDIYPEYTHYIIEDFKKTDQADTFTCKITSLITGDDSLDCSPIDGILPGGWYTVTDGIFSERVQVHSVSLENGIQRIILTKPIENTYSLENARLFRTSANITAGGATGSPARKSLLWMPGVVWSGQEANTLQTTEADFNLQNTHAFTLEGNASLTTSGGLTLSE